MLIFWPDAFISVYILQKIYVSVFMLCFNIAAKADT